MPPDRPIVPWRFVAGVLLHVALPAYVAVVAGVVLLLSSLPLALAPSLHLVLVTTAWFLPAYGALTIVAAAAARYADPLLRRRRALRSRRDPAVAADESARRVAVAAAAMAALAAAPDSAAARIGAAAARLRDGAWRHGDRAFQTLSADFAMAADAFAASFAAAGPAERAEVRQLAATALDRLADELRRLGAEHDRLDHGDARVAARYIELRYGPTDLTGDGVD